MSNNDGIKWTSKITVEKYNNEKSYKLGIPDEIVIVNGNKATNSGLNTIWNLVMGDIVSHYPLNSTNTFIGVGNSSTASTGSETGLLGINKAYAGIDQLEGAVIQYPVVIDNKLQVRCKFDSTSANFVWNEWGIFNGNPSSIPEGRPSSSVIMFNRKAEEMGTKVAGSVWVILAEISLLNTSS